VFFCLTLIKEVTQFLQYPFAVETQHAAVFISIGIQQGFATLDDAGKILRSVMEGWVPQNI